MTLYGFRWFLSVLLLLASTLGVASTPQKVMVLGDSLSAGYGIDVSQGWVSLLQQRLLEKGYGHRVINASISGNTTGDGLGRLPRLLKEHQPDVVIVALGGNDGLRGYPVKIMQGNLKQIVQKARTSGARVMLTRMEIPPNYGKRYTDQFRNSFSKVAEDEKVTLLPFLLNDVAVHAELMQQDGIHPVERAQPAILENLWPALEAFLSGV